MSDELRNRMRTVRERWTWYRVGSPGLEGGSKYRASGDERADMLDDLRTAILALEAADADAAKERQQLSGVINVYANRAADAALERDQKQGEITRLQDLLIEVESRLAAIIDENLETDNECVSCRVCMDDVEDSLHGPECPILKLTNTHRLVAAALKIGSKPLFPRDPTGEPQETR